MTAEGRKVAVSVTAAHGGCRLFRLAHLLGPVWGRLLVNVLAEVGGSISSLLESSTCELQTKQSPSSVVLLVSKGSVMLQADDRTPFNLLDRILELATMTHGLTTSSTGSSCQALPGPQKQAT